MKMGNDFVLVTRHPTPEELLERLFRLLHGFGPYWQENSSLHMDEKGSPTVHGIFAALTEYVIERFNDLDEGTLTSLFQFIEECVKADVHSHDGASNAACTCFLEDIAGEGRISKMISGYLGPASREHFDGCMGS